MKDFNEFTIVFDNDIEINGCLAGSSVRTDDSEFFEWQGNYRINRDGSLSLFAPYDHQQKGTPVVAGRWYRGH